MNKERRNEGTRGRRTGTKERGDERPEREGKGVKTETAMDDATLQFEFRASTPAASPPGRGAELRGGDGEEHRRIELKKFSLRPEKYDGKGDFEGWVNQFEEYATLGQWTEEEKSSLLFLSLTAGARMYFVGLPEREKMAYATRVEALRRRFGQETDTSIALQELAGLRRGKNQSAKELADSARRLASRAYHSNDYASQEKAALHAFQTAVGEDLQLKCAERSCRTLEMAMETVEIQERYTKKAVRALKQEESDMALQLKTMGEKLETLMGEIKDDRDEAVGGTARIGPATKGGHGVSLLPSEGPFREGMPDQHGRTLGKRTVAAFAIDAGPQEGAATEEAVTIGNGLYLLGRIGGNVVSFLVDTGSGVSILAARTWRKWGRTEDELTRYWGRLCSVEGRALECLGKARLTVTLGTRVVEWGFIVAEIGDDEGILGNDFAMAHKLTVRPCEGAVYLPDHAGTGRGHMGERLPCTIRVVTEVRAVTVVDQGPGPLGLCPVRGIVEVEQDSNIWLANTGSQPIQIDKDEVVALAECVLAEPGASAGSDRDVGDEVNGLVE